MAKVTIHTKGDYEPIEVECAPEDERFFDGLPFTSSNVLATQVRPGR